MDRNSLPARARPRLAAVMLACAFPAAAAAETAGSQLSVGAIVVPACTVSTGAQGASSGTAVLSCSQGAQGTVTTEQRQAGPVSTGSDSATSSPSTAQQTEGNIKVITITY